MDTKSALFKNVRVPARLVMLAIVLAIVGCFWKPAFLLSAAVGTFLLAVALIFRVVMKDLGSPAEETNADLDVEDEEDLVPTKVTTSKMTASSSTSSTVAPQNQELVEIQYGKLLGGKKANLAIGRKGDLFSMRGWGLSAAEIQPHKEAYFEWLNNCMADYCEKESVDLYVRISLDALTGFYTYAISTTPIHEIAPGVTVHGTSW